MPIMSINKIKKLKEESKKVTMVNFVEYIGELFDITLPFRIKSLEEQNKIIAKAKFNSKPKGVNEYTSFRKVSKEFKEFYMRDKKVQDASHSAYFLIINPEKDAHIMKEEEILMRILNVVMHIDMEYDDLVDEENNKINLWDVFGLKKDDYFGLAKYFYSFITVEELIERLEWIIIALKEKKDIKLMYQQLEFTKKFNMLPEDTQREVLEQIQKNEENKEESLKNEEEK